MSYFVEKVVSTARLTRFTGRFQLATMPAVLFTRGKGRKKILQKKEERIPLGRDYDSSNNRDCGCRRRR